VYVVRKLNLINDYVICRLSSLISLQIFSPMIADCALRSMKSLKRHTELAHRVQHGCPVLHTQTTVHLVSTFTEHYLSYHTQFDIYFNFHGTTLFILLHKHAGFDSCIFID